MEQVQRVRENERKRVKFLYRLGERMQQLGGLQVLLGTKDESWQTRFLKNGVLETRFYKISSLRNSSFFNNRVFVNSVFVIMDKGDQIDKMILV